MNLTIKEVCTSKSLIYACLFLVSMLTAHAQVTTQSSIVNANPSISSIQTYNRYDSPTDNFEVDRFYVCEGETNRTVHTRILAQDGNSYTEITNGGNVTYFLEGLANGSTYNLSFFGNSFKEPVFESVLDATRLSYIDSFDLSNTSEYRITAEVIDVHSATQQQLFEFSVNNTDCLRITQNASLIANQSYTVQGNFSETSIVVDENITGQLVITEFSFSPVDAGSDLALDQYVTVDVVGPIKNLTLSFSLTITYNQSEVDEKGLDENSLLMYNWDGSHWQSVSSNVDTAANTITFLVQGSTNGISDTRLGTFSLRGSSESQGANLGGSSPSPALTPSIPAPAPVPTQPVPTPPAQTPPSVSTPSESTPDSPSDSSKKGERGDEGGQLGQEDRRFGFLESIGLFGGGSKITGAQVFAVSGAFVTQHMFCVIIILALIILWLVTLMLWLKERRENHEKNNLVARKK